MITLKTIQEKDRPLLRDALQSYLREMSVYYDELPDKNGNYHYGYLEEYFSDPGRTAYLLYNENELIGFALLNPYSCCGVQPDYTMAEFTVFPAFRRKNLASEAVNAILERHPGRWEIKFNNRNTAAKQFWTKAVSPYSPDVIHLNPEETVLVFTNRNK